MSTITLKLSGQQEERLYHAWSDTQTKTPPYAKWQLRPENCVITCYESGKTVFQGKDADIYASAFTDTVTAPADLSETFPQAGSDEVGTGDYFGPVCVVAALITPENASWIRSLGVRDSKSLKDADIRKIAPQIMEKIPHSRLIVTNTKYNQIHETDNMNAIKAKLHNHAYIKLAEKAALPDLKIIDQFTPENTYYRYLRNQKQVVRGIHFETKAEDKYLSVGTASVIARYLFLAAMDEMEKKYGMPFQKGAGAPADACAAEFVSRYGTERLPEVAKMHFRNTEKIK